MIHHFTVGDLSCAVISDGQPRPPWEPPLAEFFTPATGVPERELRAAAAGRTTLTCGYNCVAVATGAGTAVIDAGLGRGFTGYGPELARFTAGSPTAWPRRGSRPGRRPP
ncbi:hypothetical protein ACBI99_42850 [Nonomuraea sp. ATR24]|uniref:hypothetical protein n=1 Tax=Nonomuraea sp. ATR24 TaxID=1676744 RepID=UPI0035BF7B61